MFSKIVIIILIYSFVNGSIINTMEKPNLEKCSTILESKADLDIVKQYKQFDFQPPWLTIKEFWDYSFEERYKRYHYNKSRPQLMVYVVPHSHNDPGWKQTFNEYYENKSKNIIQNIVQELGKLPNMTFVWNEISFLEKWWRQAQPEEQKAMKKLIAQGRLEITTGGWVMPDEACTHIFSLLDQFIEGHAWMITHLNTTPTTGWAIDPFGHGPTVPYILDQSGLIGTIIQRIHYSWKQWLAEKQIEDFYWIPGWKTKKPNLIVHNMPFDIYSIKHTCGPHHNICISYDFRKIPGELTEYTMWYEEIDSFNLYSKADTLIEEYHRIGSLTPHNIIIVPLGEDFSYVHASEFNDQYANYMKLFNFINSHKHWFNAHVQFGTPKEFFQKLKKISYKGSLVNFPSVKGDFFPYADIFTTGKVGYWSGFFTTRPYIKKYARLLEHQLRTAEVLFTLIYNRQNYQSNKSVSQILTSHYRNLVSSRRNLGLIQHHDAITGTAAERVLEDYGGRILTSYNQCTRIQEILLSLALATTEKLAPVFEINETWKKYGHGIMQVRLTVPPNGETEIVLFNSLIQDRTEIAEILIDTLSVEVYDNLRENFIKHQIAPVFEIDKDGRRVISGSKFRLLFVAKMPGLSAVTFTIKSSYHTEKSICKVFCASCVNTINNNFNISKLRSGDIDLENSAMTLYFDRNTGFIKSVHKKKTDTKHKLEMQFGAYRSNAFESGAYLFKPDPLRPEKHLLKDTYFKENNFILVTGPICNEITITYRPLFIYKVTLMNAGDFHLLNGIFIKIITDFGKPTKNLDTEMFMRINTDIQENGKAQQFYTDQNGFQYQKRVTIKNTGVEGNYYPITTMSWIQNNTNRMTYITNHAQGVSSFEPGRFEVMLDRRIRFDDNRGLGEGVTDNKPTVFQSCLLLEMLDPEVKVPIKNDENNTTKDEYSLPSQSAIHISRKLNYPINIYYFKNTTRKSKKFVKFCDNFPNDLHLLTLRTISNGEHPSSFCYMVLHRPGHSCQVGTISNQSIKFTSKSIFKYIKLKNITAVSLTGIKDYYGLESLENIHLEPMTLKTYRLNFTCT